MRTQTFDVDVIGGGVVGAGCALDAAARGLDVALIEARDLASGTSSRSSKLVHRGLRYGALIEDLLALIEEDPSLGEPLGGADDYLRVEVRYAAPAEGALHLDDALARRTRISIETFHRGVDTAQEAAELMADVLGWDAGRESQEQPDDEAADEIRRGAPDAYGELSATGNP